MSLLTSRNLAAAAVGLACIVVPTVAWSADFDGGDDPAPASCSGNEFGAPFARTDLFFGLSRPDGKPIRNREFNRFIDKEVTPRFPDGLTVLEADGQFKDSTGTIIEEESRVLVLLYPPDEPALSKEIEAIRDAYKYEFDQESVLRVDDETCVSF
jgi:Protein of unknown function (DUF3574)